MVCDVVSAQQRPSKSPVLMRPSAGSEEFEAVLRLGKEAKATVGFLKDAPFIERAQKGTLLAASVQGEVVAYLLYDLPRDEVRIVHLVVGREHRGLGLARLLVEELASEQAHRRGIFLSCRNDFEADKLWERLDLVPLREKPGRSNIHIPDNRVGTCVRVASRNRSRACVLIPSCC